MRILERQPTFAKMRGFEILWNYRKLDCIFAADTIVSAISDSQ